MSGFIYYVEILLATYAALIVGLYTLSLRIPAAAFLARILASYAALIIASGYGVFISICFRFVGFQRSGQWATGRCFKYAMQLGTGVTFKIEDPHNYLNTIRPAVFVGNHQTELDVLMLGCMFPKYCAVAAKSSLRKVPILGWFMSLSGTVFINRTDPKDARAAMTGAAKEMTSKRQSVYMFPEGTRSYSKEPMLLPFKKGAFHLAVQAGIPIVPVVAANYSDVLYVKDWKFRSGVIAVKGRLITVKLNRQLKLCSSKTHRNQGLDHR
jgi:lysophosphatidate acyltransferase